MKKFFKIKLLLILLLFGVFIFSTEIFAAAPSVNCIGLPGCADGNTNGSNNITLGVVTKLIGESIKYVAVIAVLSLMVSGVMYIISGGEEDKIKKSKSAIIWSLVGVFLSISAWTIINLINSIKI